MTDDYYELLGVSKNASRDEIKKAYKRLARKYHPDNKETGDAEHFKKINAAAAVLSDDKKRQHYDQYGTADPSGFGGGQGGFDFGGFESFQGDFGDLFDHLGDIFGGGFGFGGRGRRRRQLRGEDLRYDIDITLEEAAFGTTKTIQFTKLDTCPECKGTGAESPDAIKTCPDCKGAGQVRRTQRTPFGLFQTNAPCNTCRGTGKTIEKECSHCDGTGLVRTKKKLDVRIPAGIDDEMRLRLEGEGEAIPNGINGDLYVFVHVKPDERFTRKGNDIYLEYPISVSQAALGTEIEVPTLLGKAKLRIPAGTQPDTIFKMKDKGIQHLQSSAKGSQLVKVKIKVPTSLSKKERKLFEELDAESKKSGFFKRLFE
ncbi:MAG: molecular chaperone DnaJ [Candidatus Woesearchaeota archaeon]